MAAIPLELTESFQPVIGAAVTLRPLQPGDVDIETAFVEGLSPELQSALASLGDPEREVVVLRVVLELDGETTARVLGISPTAVSTRLSRALARLEERMRTDEGH